MSYFKPIGDAKILEKKPPKSVVYDDVKTTLNTGLVRKKKEETNSAKLFKKLEHFKRMKGSELMKLVLLKMNSNTQVEEEVDERKEFLSTLAPSSVSEAKLAVHQMQPILVKSRVKEDVSDSDNHVLLLDLRDEDDYKTCHIHTAYCYPSARLNRTVNPYTPEMLSFKNHPLKKIVLYDKDEKVASLAGNMLFEKGFDNIVMLTGGVQEFAIQYPNMVSGEIPKEWLPVVKKRPTRSIGSAASSTRSVTTTKTADTPRSKNTSTSTKWR